MNIFYITDQDDSVCISAYFQYGSDICSSKAVRFRMGYPICPLIFDEDVRDDLLSAHQCMDDEFIWTYTLPEFLMAQVSSIVKCD